MAEVPDWGLDEIRDHGTRAEGPDMAADAAADPAAHNPLFAAPMQLCRPSACHTFLEAVPETLQALRDVSSPVVVVAGVGSQRIGKSTILNLLHSRRTSGFGLGHTLDAQTAGIWVWMRKHPKDPSVCVCFADTEGLDTPHIQQSYNWMLSSLTLLISSVFLYQSKSTIDSSATERLSTILAVAEQMLGQDNGGTSATTKPYFVWVLRDMQLQMHNDPKTEMMEKLETGHIRKMKRSFKEFDCFPLPRPVDTEEGLQEVETMKFEALKKNFQEDFFLFDRFVFKLAATAPMCGSSAVTGPVLSELVGRYIDAIRDRKGLLSSITELPSQAQLIAKMAAEKALKDGKASYNQALDGLMSRLPLSLFDVYQEHRLALSSAEKTMVDAAVGVEELDMKEMYDKLRAYALDEQPAITLSPNAVGFTAERQVRGRFLPVLEANEKLAHEASHKLWQGAYAHVAAGVLATPCAFSSIKEYDDAVAACKQSVLEEANVGGGRAALERYLASSKQLTSDRETVTHKLFACQLAAVQEEARKQVEAMGEAFKSHLSHVRQELEGAMEKESAARVELQGLLRQEIADALRQERDQRQGLHEMLLKEQLERTQAVADVNAALQREEVERAERMGELRAELQAGDKRVDALRLETQEHVHALRESITALDAKTLAAQHEAQNRGTKLEENLQGVDGRLGKTEEALAHSAAEAQKELLRVESAATAKVQELDTKCSAATQDLCAQLQEHQTAAKTQMEDLNGSLASQSSAFDSRLSVLQQDLSSLQFANDDMENRLTEATSAAKAAADDAAMARREAAAASESASGQNVKIKELEERAVEMNQKALDAAQQAVAAKIDMEKAAAAAIASAHREMEEVWLGSATDKSNNGNAGPGAAGIENLDNAGYGTRVRDFIRRLNL